MYTETKSKVYSSLGVGRLSKTFAGLFMLIAIAGSARAQNRESTDMDRPVRVTTNEVTGPIRTREIFYTLVAGPGELTMTLDLMQENTGATVAVTLHDKDAKQIDSFYAWSLTHNARQVERVSFTRRQQVFMTIAITNAGDPYRGTFRLRFAGALELPQAATATSVTGVASNGATMRITMKDGSVQDIDLSRVQRVIIIP